jgi:hypothetical protein
MAHDLVIGGVPVRVRKNTFKRLAPLVQGGRTRNADNSLTSTEDPDTLKRLCRCEPYFISEAELAALQAVIPLGTAVTISGELPGATYSAVCTLGEGTLMEVDDGVLSALHPVYTLDIEEA